MTSRTEGGQGYTQSYDAENRLVGVSGAGSASFVYDGDGTLIKKTLGTVTTRHYFPTWEVQNGTLIKYYLLGGKRVAVRSGCDLYYLHTDHLGSTSLVTTSTGGEQGRQRYLPFGGTRASGGSLPTDKLYTGQEYVAGIGLYNYGARFYAVGLARFLSPDTLGVADTNPQTLNRYSYVLNNPLLYTDPTGHDPLSKEEKTKEDWWIQARLFILIFGHSEVYDPVLPDLDSNLMLADTDEGRSYRSHMMRDNQDRLGGKIGFATAVDRLAGLYTNDEIGDFVHAVGTLFAGLSYQNPLVNRGSITKIAPRFDVAGFDPDVLDAGSDDPANTHHYAAFLVAGYRLGRFVGDRAVDVVDPPGPFSGSEADRVMGFRAVQHGDELYKRSWRPNQLGRRIMESI